MCGLSSVPKDCVSTWYYNTSDVGPFYQLELTFNKVRFPILSCIKIESHCYIKGTPRTLIRSQNQNMWVFKPELVDLYQKGDNAPYGSTLHRIERHQFTVYDPEATLIAFRVLHTRNY